MFGDDDPEIAPFFAKFLGEGIRVQPSTRKGGRHRYDPDGTALTDGLAVGLAGAAAILEGIEEAAAPRARKRYERAETFNRMLEDMANGIMRHGPNVHVGPTTEATPRSSVSEPPVASVSLVSETAQPLPRSFLPLDPKPPEKAHQGFEIDEPDDLLDGEQSSASSDHSTMDAIDITNAATPDRYPHKFAPTDFGASRPVDGVPSNHVRLSVELNNGRCIFDNIDVDLDSSIEDMYVRVETKIGKSIATLVTRHGMQLERADLPLKWSGLESGDLVTAVYHGHPPSRERRLEPVSPSRDDLATMRVNKLFSSNEPVSMGIFGDAIAQTKGAYPSSQTASAPSRAPAFHLREPEAVQKELPDHWFGGLELTRAFQDGGVDPSVVPPIPPGSDTFDRQAKADARSLPMPPECMPDEFEDLPADAFLTTQQDVDINGGVDKNAFEKSSPSKPRQPRKAAESPPPPTAAALGPSTTPTSSRLSDLSYAPTPARRSHGQSAPGQCRADPEDSKRKMEEKQRQNDAIWASIAASLEPAQLEPTKRTLLSQTASAGVLSRKLQPLTKRHR